MAKSKNDRYGPSQYDVTYKWRRGDRTGFTVIGLAFANEDGSIRLSLNAAPVPGLAADPGVYVLYPRKVEVKESHAPQPPGAQEQPEG